VPFILNLIKRIAALAVRIDFPAASLTVFYRPQKPLLGGFSFGFLYRRL